MANCVQCGVEIDPAREDIGYDTCSDECNDKACQAVLDEQMLEDAEKKGLI